MSTLAPRLTAFEIRGAALPADEHRSDRLFLRATGDGWALLGPEGELVYHGLGRRGRRECLEFARDRGVLSVFS